MNKWGNKMDYSFKLEEKKKNEKRKKRMWLRILLFLFIGIGVLYTLITIIYHNFFYLPKRNHKKDYVYTARKDVNDYADNTYSKMPKINLKGDTFDKINKKIEENYLFIIHQGDYDYEYEFSKSRNILSLKISYSYYVQNEIYPHRYFKTYNINLNNGHIYSTKELLDKYHITEKRLNSFLKYRFETYYNDLVKYKYFTKKECDYSCYLKNRGISSNYLDNIHLYINNGSLVLYKFFYTYSDFEEEEYFQNPTYRFIIKK